MNVIGKMVVDCLCIYLFVFVTINYCLVGIISADDTCRSSGYGYSGIKYSSRQPYNCTLYSDPHNPGENRCAARCSRLKTLCPFYTAKAGNCTVCVSSEANNTTIEALTVADYSLEPTAFIFEKQDTQNQCFIDSCFNNGTCIDGYLDYNCNCNQGLTGKSCEKKVVYECREVGAGKHVSAGLAGVWAISESDTVMLRQDEAWISVGNTALETISSGLIVCGCHGHAIYCKQGFTEENPSGDAWTRVSDGGLMQVDVNKHGYWWGINGDSGGRSVYKRGNPTSSWIGSGFDGVDNGYQQVTMGGAGVWVITTGGQVKYRVGTYEDDLSTGSAWQVVDLQGVNGSALYIESTDGCVWLCTSTYAVYRRAFSVDHINDVSWENVSEINNLHKISVGPTGKIWGITGNNKVMECTGNMVNV